MLYLIFMLSSKKLLNTRAREGDGLQIFGTSQLIHAPAHA